MKWKYNFGQMAVWWTYLHTVFLVAMFFLNVVIMLYSIPAIVYALN